MDQKAPREMQVYLKIEDVPAGIHGKEDLKQKEANSPFKSGSM